MNCEPSAECEARSAKAGFILHPSSFILLLLLLVVFLFPAASTSHAQAKRISAFPNTTTLPDSAFFIVETTNTVPNTNFNIKFGDLKVIVLTGLNTNQFSNGVIRNGAPITNLVSVGQLFGEVIRGTIGTFNLGAVSNLAVYVLSSPNQVAYFDTNGYPHVTTGGADGDFLTWLNGTPTRTNAINIDALNLTEPMPLAAGGTASALTAPTNNSALVYDSQKGSNVNAIIGGELSYKDRLLSIPNRWQGFALQSTPRMGFNSFNMGWNGTTNFSIGATGAVRCTVSEPFLLTIATQWVRDGLLRMGYNWAEIDDGWQGSRVAGTITVNSNQFPSGMKHCVDALHDLGFKVSLYQDLSDDSSCCLKTSMSNNYVADVTTYKQWGIDGVDLDTCHTSESDEIKQARHELLKAEIMRQNLNVHYRIHYNPQSPDVTPTAGLYTNQNFLPWAAQFGSFMRTYELGTYNPNYWLDVLKRIDLARQAAPYVSRGHFMNLIFQGAMDPREYNFALGRLENGMTAMYQAERIYQNNFVAFGQLGGIYTEYAQYQTNEYIIRINQDKMLSMPTMVFSNANIEAWKKDLDDGSKTLCYYTRSNVGGTLDIPAYAIGAASNEVVTLFDIWGKTNIAGMSNMLTFTVGNTQTCAHFMYWPKNHHKFVQGDERIQGALRLGNNQTGISFVNDSDSHFVLAGPNGLGVGSGEAWTWTGDDGLLTGGGEFYAYPGPNNNNYVSISGDSWITGSTNNTFARGTNAGQQKWFIGSETTGGIAVKQSPSGAYTNIHALNWNTPTNTPTADYVLTASGAGNDTRWAASAGGGGGAPSTFDGAFKTTAGGTNYQGPLTNFLAKTAFAITNDANGDNVSITPNSITVTSSTDGYDAILTASGTRWPSNIFQVHNNLLNVSTNSKTYASNLVTTTLYTADGSSSLTGEGGWMDFNNTTAGGYRFGKTGLGTQDGDIFAGTLNGAYTGNAIGATNYYSRSFMVGVVGSDSAITTTARYGFPYGSDLVSSATESLRTAPCNFGSSDFLTNLVFQTTLATGSGTNVTITLRTNGVDSALACTLLGTGTRTNSLTGSVNLSGVTNLSMKLTSSIAQSVGVSYTWFIDVYTRYPK